MIPIFFIQSQEQSTPAISNFIEKADHGHCFTYT